MDGEGLKGLFNDERVTFDVGRNSNLKVHKRWSLNLVDARGGSDRVKGVDNIHLYKQWMQ